MTLENEKALAVRIRGLNVRLGGRRVLEGVDLDIGTGELVALIGPNGAGKTTLLRSLLGLIPIESGEMRVLGETDVRRALPRIGYVPQRLALETGLPLSVREFLSLRRTETRNWFWRTNLSLDGQLPPMAHELGVVGLLDRPMARLSGGQLQRVLIAFSLLSHPQLLFLDEPTEGVDAPGERTFYEVIADIHRNHPLTVVLVSHDLSMVHRHASVVVALNGRVCCQGAPDEVIRGEALREAYGLHVTSYHHHHAE
ncbi:MAG: metal ABC transporter ATP-binding protein [Verrucomicrobiae bacterium]|nr:metal ABC transporter ATP-binding protein [Verrucomicrobiae bacterium]